METADVGEVLNGKCRVEAVEEDEVSELFKQRIALRDDEEAALIRRVGRNEQGSVASTPLLSSHEAVAVEGTSDGQSPYLARFEVRSGHETLINVVQAERPNAFGASSSAEQWRSGREGQSGDSGTEDRRPFAEPEQRQAPCPSRVLIQKCGAGLEVGIPPCGLGLDAAYLLVASTLALGMACGVTFVTPVFAILAQDPSEYFNNVGCTLKCCVGFLSWLPNVVLSWTIGIALFRSTVRRIFVHENLLITRTHYRLERTIEFRRRSRDSFDDPTGSEAGLSLMDRIFCKQLSGATADLRIAAIRHLGVSVGNRFDHFVLLDDEKEHRLYAVLSDEEMDWLCSEINETLREINGSLVSLEQLALARMNGAKQYFTFCFRLAFD